MKGFAYLEYQEGDFPISERLSQTIVSLPMHPYLNHDDIDLIVKTLRYK
jgi:dTDP-4-amino-4,6-dideoxygalactose transaminase